LEKSKAISQFKKQIKKIEDLKSSKNDSTEFKKWIRSTKFLIENNFGIDSDYCKDFSSIRYTPIHIAFSDSSINELCDNTLLEKSEFLNGLEQAESLLKSYIKELDEYPDDTENSSNQINFDKSKVFVDINRIEELSKIKNDKFDLTRLVQLCKELNIATTSNSYLTITMITRTIINHIPPIFNYKTFKEVANNCNAGKSFRELMLRLEESSRKISNIHLQKLISSSETLPNYTQVNFTPEMDCLLSEIITILNK
jgi:hypothetical protein